MNSPIIADPPLTSVGIRHIVREPGFWLTLLLAVGLYVARPAALSLRGEETRRGMIAREMIDSGDWLVPAQQGIPRLTKPPLHYWMIAAAGIVRGQVDVWAIRIPSMLAIVMTVVVIYVYARQFGSALFAFGSAIGFASMVQVLQIGRLGETEALFTLLLSSSLFFWHWALERRGSAMWAWTVGYGLCALAMLAKGPQAPFYFVGGTATYLVLTRRWRELFRPSHFAGAALALAVVGLWIVPYAQEVGWTAVERIFVGEAALRMGGPQWGPLASHLVSFPFKLIGCLLPWSFLGFAYLHRPLRAQLWKQSAAFRFSLVCIAVALPTVWCAPGGRTRYLMPIFPMCAILTGLVFAKIAEVSRQDPVYKFWRNYVHVAAAICVAAGIALFGLSLFRPGHDAAESAPLALLFLLLAAIAGGYSIRQARHNAPGKIVAAAAALTAFWGIAYCGPAQNLMIRRSTEEPRRIVRLREQLQGEAQLQSLGLVHHFFAFHYREPIAALSRPSEFKDVRPGDYFCYDFNEMRHTIPFDWEKIAVISCDRVRLPKPMVTVIVGRRLPLSESPAPEVLAADPDADGTTLR